jgi:hypothetical protein
MTRNALPLRAPIGLLLALFVTVLAGIATAVVEGNSLSAVQRFYAGTFLATSLRSRLPGGSRLSEYEVLRLGGKPSDQTACRPDARLITGHLKGEVSGAGTCLLSVSPSQMTAWLGHFVYDDQGFRERFAGAIRGLGHSFRCS